VQWALAQAEVDVEPGVDDAGVDDAGVDDAGVDDAGVDDAGVELESLVELDELDDPPRLSVL
jgi:hypothetical protein